MTVTTGLQADNIVLFPGFSKINGNICMGGRKYRNTDALLKAFHAMPDKEYRHIGTWMRVQDQYYRETRDGYGECHGHGGSQGAT
jgi:hypothetical protein